MTDITLVRTLFRKFAINCSDQPVLVNEIDIQVGPYLFTWLNGQYEVRFCNKPIKHSLLFTDVVKYAIGHWNRDQMDDYLYQPDWDEPDPAREAEDRALAGAYARLYP